MANSRCPLQLLFLGLLVSPAFLQKDPCDIVKNTVTPGSFSLDVSPRTFRPGDIYTITINGIENSTSVLLQALSKDDGRSWGLWEMESEAISCSSNEYLVQKNVSGNSTRTRWTAPGNANSAAMTIRGAVQGCQVPAQAGAFVTFANGTTLMQSRTLKRDLTTGLMTPMPSTATGVHRPTLFSNSTNARLNATMVTHNWASSHQQHQVPYSSASTAQARSILLAAMQFLPVFLGFKLLS